MATLASPAAGVSTSARKLQATDTQLIVAPTFIELAILMITSALGGVALMLEGAWPAIINVAVPIVLMWTMGRAVIQMLGVSVASVWTPLLWLRAAIFFYGGFGTIALILANDASRSYAEYFFTLYALDILKYNVVLVLFTFVTLGTIRALFLAQRGTTGFNLRYSPRPSAIGFAVIGMAFVIIGAIANFVFIVPYQFGYVQTTYPAFLSEIGQAGLIGLFLTTVALSSRRSPMVWLIVLLGLVYVYIGLLSFSKSLAVMPWVMLVLAYFYLHPTLRRALVMAGSILALYFGSAPLVDHGRYLMSTRYGGIDAPASLEERNSMVASYFEPGQGGARDSDVDYSTLRFSYVNVGSFVVSLYDSGQPGNTYDNAVALFIPRFLWKDKPIITDGARELSYQLTGNWNNSLAAGLAPEAYWNGGWLGVVLIGMLLGAIIYGWSIYSLAVQFSGAWHLFPVVLLGARVGSRFSGFLVSDILGSMTYALVGHVILTLANAAFFRRQQRKGER